MPLTLYQASIPVFIRGFSNLSAVLEKAKAHGKIACLAEGIGHKVFTHHLLAGSQAFVEVLVEILAGVLGKCRGHVSSLEQVLKAQA